jgi:MFS family permease
MAAGGLLERRWAASCVAGGTVGVFLAMGLVEVLVDHRKGPGGGFFGLGFVVATLVVGFIVARHQPRNPIGWLMLCIPASTGSFLLAQALSTASRHHPLVALGFGLATQLLYYAFILSAPLVVLFFPDGHLPSPRWRPALRAYLASAGALALLTIGAFAWLATGQHLHITETGSPSGSPPAIVNILTVVLLVGDLALALSWVVRRIGGYRRSTAAVRQQYKWLAVGAVSLVAALVLSFVTSGGNSTFSQVDNALTGVLALPFPVTVGMAILRYRLYDIDRVISRTVSYALLTGALVGLYVGVVAFTTRVLPFSSSSSVAVAVSTLVAAAAFNPLRRRLQRMVDRRFNRSRYDAERTVTAFAERLRSTLVLDAVEDDLRHAVHRALEPSAVTVWLRPAAPRADAAVAE